LAVLNATANSQ